MTDPPAFIQTMISLVSATLGLVAALAWLRKNWAEQLRLSAKLRVICLRLVEENKQ
jgi:hypothetical protein